MFVISVAHALKEAHVEFALAGGYALALHGAVRGTLELDIVLRLDRKNFLDAAAALGGLRLEPRLPATAEEVFAFRREYVKNRGLSEWDLHNPADPSQRVDIVLTHDLRDIEVAWIESGDLKLPVVARADLAAMKRARGLPQDLEDARALERLAS
jgi:hypothetical protein